jgi:hypothetical protein
MSNEMTLEQAIELYPSIHNWGQIKEILGKLSTVGILNEKNLRRLACQVNDFTGAVGDDWKFSAVRPVTNILSRLRLLNQANFELIANEKNAERFYFRCQNLSHELDTAVNIQKLLNVNHDTGEWKALRRVMYASWFQQEDFDELMTITSEHRRELDKALENVSGYDRDSYEKVKKTIVYHAQKNFMDNVMTLSAATGFDPNTGTVSILSESIVHLIASYAMPTRTILSGDHRSALVTSAYHASRKLLRDNLNGLSDTAVENTSGLKQNSCK